jgi:hypothetical protein
MPRARKKSRVSPVCPRCGATEHRKVRPRTLVAFANDRVCLECDTRYTPPTPLWAALAFLAVGAVLGLAGLAGVTIALVLLVLRGHFDPFFLGLGAALAALGGAALWHGTRSLAAGGDV